MDKAQFCNQLRPEVFQNFPKIIDMKHLQKIHYRAKFELILKWFSSRE